MVFLVGDGRVLPGDALEALAEHGISAVRHGSDRVTLETDGVSQDFVLAHYSGPGMPPASLIEQARIAGLPVLMALSTTSGRLAKSLAATGLNWVDLAGNASIHVPGLRVAIQGRPAVALASRYAVSAAFRPAGLQVLLAVLVMSTDRVPTLRALAEGAGVSLGAAQACVADLRAQGYVDAEGRLVRGGELLERWVSAYAMQEQGRWGTGSYEGDLGWWQHPEAFLDEAACLGGEAAAEAMGLPLRSVTGIVYADAVPGKVIRAGRLRRVDDGNVLLRPRFWALPGQGWIAPSPLIYAELRASGDGRQTQIADEMRETDAVLRRLGH